MTADTILNDATPPGSGSAPPPPTTSSKSQGKIIISAVALIVLVAAGVFLVQKQKHGSDSASAASDSLGQAQIRDAAVTAETCYTDNNSYSGCDALTLSQIEPSLNFVKYQPISGTAGLPGVGAIVFTGGGQSFSAATWDAASQTCYTVVATGSSPTLSSFASAGMSCIPQT